MSYHTPTITPKSNYTKRAAKEKAKEIQKRHVIDSHGRLYYFIKGTVMSFLISVPLFFIIGYAIKITDFPEEYMSPALLSTILISIVISAFYSTAAARSKGWFNGTLVGFVYMFALVIIRWILESRISFNKDILTMLLCGLLIGSICGIAGLNLGDKIRNTLFKNHV